MITTTFIFLFLAIWANIKVYKLSKKEKIDFNPLEHGIGIWFWWAFSNITTLGMFIYLEIKYLP